MIRELLPVTIDPKLLARVAAAHSVTVVADPKVGRSEIRRAGQVWRCHPADAANLRALLSHR